MLTTFIFYLSLSFSLILVILVAHKIFNPKLQTLMTLNEYQTSAATTIQSYNSQNEIGSHLGFLGLAGESGTVLTTLKKYIRDGDGFGNFHEKLKEELGDVLWYVALIATQNNIKLGDIAVSNLAKTKDRFLEQNLIDIPRFDINYPEKFPDSFTINFTQQQTPNGLSQVKMVWEKGDGQQVTIGDPLTDNAKEPNNYRFHDVFHLGHVAYLGWSPVMRDLMDLKRKSNHTTWDTEDKGRPQVAEEAITLIVYNYAKGNKMLQASDRIDTELLNSIKQLVVDLEVSSVSSFQWEKAILGSYKVFHKLLENKGGKVMVSPKDRRLDYLGI
ncbi:nucleoside triphosphate pyrophosphohydrolase family protein [Chitinophaga varians]|uniref:nucleoside triphosphate pyrophosphohydrolase family protein n=1 Tax=Chitinophaga varians TaxID=2202339 RepID=UPI00165FA7EF|nr:nucleoside triphosphate pyrophosphohydrolase family protein [Chitinophaga varians]MBC9911045.1 nucleotide pyrophosphohydrolase [Chitinophaga varians]